MEQFRRKLKFKAKEKRQEINQIKKQARVSEIDPLLGHDPAAIQSLKHGSSYPQNKTEPVNQES